MFLDPEPNPCQMLACLQTLCNRSWESGGRDLPFGFHGVFVQDDGAPDHLTYFSRYEPFLQLLAGGFVRDIPDVDGPVVLNL